MDFLKLLFKCGLIGFNKSSQVLSEVGIFFVRKKSGKLRLILDCRRTNQYFRTPPSGSTTGLGALSGVRVPAGKTLYGSSYDIKDMFYRLRVPVWLQKYLGLPSLAAGEVRQHFGDVIPADWGNDVSVSPTFLVLPMVFSWSFCFAQEVLREAIRVSLPHVQFVVDRSPVGEVGDSCSLAMAYADNGYHFSTSRDVAEDDARTVEQYLNKIGLATHEETVACSTCIVLGGALDGSGLVLRPKASRIGLLCSGLLAIEKGRPISGKQMEHIVGHLNFVCLTQRLSLSVLSHTYTYIHECYHLRRPVWKTVKRELRNMRGGDATACRKFRGQSLPLCLHVRCLS